MFELTFQDRSQQLLEQHQRRTAQGITQMVVWSADQFRANVTARQVSPPGSSLGCPEGVRSCPGQYPFRDFGTGERSIGWAFDLATMSGRFGVTDAGMHLVHLEQGSHPRGGPFDRLGMEHQTLSSLSQLREQFLDGYRRAT